MADIIIYGTGAVCILAALTVAVYLLGWAFLYASDRVCRQILRYRRLSWLRYWADRLEREGLLPLDEHYRAIAQANPPKTRDDAQQCEQEAMRRG